MSISAAGWQLAWQVHFTRRRLPWPSKPRPLLALWEPAGLAGWLDAEDVSEGLPFLLDPEGLYVLFFIQLSTRQVTVTGITARPDAAWVTQQARNATMDLNDRQVTTRFLLRDHDAKFTGAFDEIFRTEGAEVIRTPIRAPRANAYAERWVQTVRAECFDWTLVLGRRHLLRLLRVYVRHYNEQRPHRGLALRVPLPGEQRSTNGRAHEVRCRDVLGGLIHEYQAVAA